MIWLNLEQPKKAYPLLKILNRSQKPEYAWMSSLVKTCVELGKDKEAEAVLSGILSDYPSQVKSWKLAVWLSLQQGNYKDAVAAKEIVLHFEPDVEGHKEDLSRLYLLAGVPKQAARFYRRRIGEKPTTEQLEHLVDIYLSGQMYEQALNVALEVVGREKTAEALESLGDIYYALHRYDESGTAYEQAAGLSSEPSPDFLMKAGYSAMKSKQYTRAAAHFEQVVGAGSGDEEQVQLAMQNLAWIRRLQAWQID